MQIAPNVHWVGINDTKSKIFEELWSIPMGVNINSYLVKGKKKNVLIDTMKGQSFEEYIKKLQKIIDPKELDYIVLNHVEPDHAGSLSKLLSIAQKASVISSKNGIDFLRHYHKVPFNDIVVNDNTSLDLGGKTLRFISTPCLHWPETMATFLEPDNVLFSGDLFGAFDAIGNNIFDDKINETTINAAKRYFSSILSPYAPFVDKAIQKLCNLKKPIKVIAPSHGIIYKNDPSIITKIYADLCSTKYEKKVVIAYGSMYGNTESIAKAIGKGVTDSGVKAVFFNITKSDISEMLTEIWKAPAIAIGSPVYDGYIFPPVSNLLEFIKLKRIKNRVFGLFGNYTWGGVPLLQMEGRIKEMKSEIIGPLLKTQGLPTDNNIEAAKELGSLLANAAIMKTNESSKEPQNSDSACML